MVVEQDFLMTLDYIKWIKEPELDPNTKEGFTKLTKVLFMTENDRYNYSNLIHRFLRLLNSPKIKEFLKKCTKSIWAKNCRI
ncbi:hypothetical protein [Mycoplasmopsis cynos]|uniref:hypothetical protein n=1 Tax=Mycoplasmopsis cynos TaxID=171284 RepID=UPI0021F96024|nr:hypothetical protein [Mycoplasmopsis cynos]UWV82593.1 hypothetical protein NW067_06645 [Mycoplasmopsis cynos]